RSLTSVSGPVGHPTSTSCRRPPVPTDAAPAFRSSSSHRYASAVATPNDGLMSTTPSRVMSSTGYRSSPRPRPLAVPPCRKNGTSDPSPAASVTSSRRDSRPFQTRFRPTSAAAASALPPPSPAATGICFSSRMCASRGSPFRPSACHSRSAACQTRLSRSAGTPGARQNRPNGPGRAWIRTVSASAIDCISVRTSWKPSSRRGPTRSVRLILAEARRTTARDITPSTFRDNRDPVARRVDQPLVTYRLEGRVDVGGGYRQLEKRCRQDRVALPLYHPEPQPDTSAAPHFGLARPPVLPPPVLDNHVVERGRAQAPAAIGLRQVDDGVGQIDAQQ